MRNKKKSNSIKAEKSYGFQNFNLVRRIARELLVNGYRGYREFIDLPGDSDSTYNERVKKVYYALEPCMSWPGRGRNSIWSDEMRISENPLYVLFKTYHMSGNSQYALHFVILDILSDGEAHSLADIHRQIVGNGPGAKTIEDELQLSHDIEPFVKKKLIKQCGDGKYRLSVDIRDQIRTHWPEMDVEIEPYLRVLANRKKLTKCELIDALRRDALNHRYYGLPYFKQKNHISQRLDGYYLDVGLIKKEEGRGYSLPKSNLSSLLEKYPLLEDAILFFSEYSPLGVIGSYLMDEYELHNNRYVFKNQHLAQALDSIVLCDILEAIRKHTAIEINAEQTTSYIPVSKVIYPICILSSTFDGRQHVLAYDSKPTCREYSDGKEKAFKYENNPNTTGNYTCVRLDNIYMVLPIPELAPISDSVFRNGLLQLSNMWGTTVRTAPFPIVVRFNCDKKQTIKNIFREKRISNVIENPQGIVELSLNIYDPREMVPWLLTYIGSLTDITVNRSSLGQKDSSRMIRRIKAHVEDLYRQYHGLPRYQFGEQYIVRPQQRLTSSSMQLIENDDKIKSAPESKYIPTLKERLDNLDKAAQSSEIFQPIYSKYIQCLKGILNRTIGHHSREEFRRIVLEEKKAHHIHCKSDKDMDREITGRHLYHDKEGNGWRLIQQFGKHQELAGIIDDGENAHEFCSCLLNTNGLPHIPLTPIQVRWLFAILNDEKIHLFLNKKEITNIMESLVNFGFHVPPLYVGSNIRYYDQFDDGDDYSSSKYLSVFRTLVLALRDNVREVRIGYCSQKEKASNKNATTYYVKPIRLEYSKQSNKFQLLGIFTRDPLPGSTLIQRNDSKMFSARLSNIESVEISDKCPDEEIPEYKESKYEEPIVVRILNIYEAIERFHMTFSPYSKTTRYEGEKVFTCSDGNKYRVDACLVTMNYCKRDEKEVMNKLRSLGRAVEIISPAKIRRDFIRRVDKQYQLFVESGFMMPIATSQEK